MNQFVLDRDGIGWVPNPVLPEENFADKWRLNPRLRDAFEAWSGQVLRDLRAAADCRGLDRVVRRLSDVLGPEVARSAESFGRSHSSARETGVLTTASGSGLLVAGGSGCQLPDHTFYGRG